VNRTVFFSSLSDLKNRSENLAGRGQILTILKGNSRSIAQKSGEICTVQTDLQPISFKSDRLLGTFNRQVWTEHPMFCALAGVTASGRLETLAVKLKQPRNAILLSSEFPARNPESTTHYEYSKELDRINRESKINSVWFASC
jgi:hypothetical protein